MPVKNEIDLRVKGDELCLPRKILKTRSNPENRPQWSPMNKSAKSPGEEAGAS
jgi:hypothetical protein